MVGVPIGIHHLKIVATLLYFSLFKDSVAQVVPPKVTAMLREMKLERSQRYQVFCVASKGELPLTFHWVKNGQPLIETSDVSVRRLDDFSSSLIITSVREDHAGNYSCIVSNMAGTDSVTTTLKVLVPPSWLHQPYDMSVLSGARVSLRCEAAGNPKPTISWKRTKGFNAHDVEQITGTKWRLQESGVLSTNSVHKDQEGMYSCEASNGVGERLKKTVRLEVQVPPSVKMENTLVTVKRGEKVAVHCNATGDTPLTLVWKVGGKLLKEVAGSNIKLSQYHFDGGVASSVAIEKADADDSALYTCAGSNAFGTSAAFVRLRVIESPGRPLNFTATGVWSRSVRLKWTQPHSGNSAIKLYLVQHSIHSGNKNGKSGAERHEVQVQATQTAVHIQELHPYTSYEFYVLAENEVGRSDPSLPVFVTTHEEEPRGPPVAVQAATKGATFVEIKWKDPPRSHWNGELKGFYIGYKSSGSDSRHFSYRTVDIDKSGPEHRYLLLGLQPSTTYTVVVGAFNAVGVGPFSEQLLVKTSYGEPPAIPAVSVISTRHSTVDVKIQSDRRKRTPAAEYVLHLREKGGQWQEVPLSITLSHSYSLGGLQSGVQYQIYVTAKNQFGDSGPTDVLSFRTEQAYKAGGFLLPSEEGAPFYQKLSFIIPVAVSLTIVIVVPLAACCCLHKLTSLPPLDTEGVEARGFTYTPAPSTQPELPPSSAQARSLPRVPVPAQSTYSTLQNYGSVMEDDEPRYDSVVEEMKTVINAKPRFAESSLS